MLMVTSSRAFDSHPHHDDWILKRQAIGRDATSATPAASWRRPTIYGTVGPVAPTCAGGSKRSRVKCQQPGVLFFGGNSAGALRVVAQYP
jgi:hypothetical protein